MSSLEKCLFMSLIGIFSLLGFLGVLLCFFFLVCVCVCVYVVVFWGGELCKFFKYFGYLTYHLQLPTDILSHCHFVLLVVSFTVQKLFILVYLSLFLLLFSLPERTYLERCFCGQWGKKKQLLLVFF